PLTGAEVTLDPGAHVIELNADGYRTFRQEVNLAPGGTLEISAQLEPTAWAARLVVTASVPAATVYIDDQFVGTGHADRHLPAGDHRIEVHAPGFDVYHRSVRIGV